MNETLEPEFWKKKPLEKLSKREWEALCARCGRCCLLKCGDERYVFFTNAFCRHFEISDCSCRIYSKRLKCKTCVEVNLRMVRAHPELLPDDCAYKLLVAGEELPPWHPLISGTPDSVERAGKSVRNLQVIPEFLRVHRALQFLFQTEKKK